MKHSLWVCALLLVLTSACAAAPITSPRATDTRGAARACTPVSPQDADTRAPYKTIIEPFDLVAPSGNRIAGMIRRPDPAQSPNACFAAVVLVPGGINPGRLLAMGQDARALAEAGMVVLTFNAEGRADKSPEDIASEGSEDYNGYRHQDGLCALVTYAMNLAYVIPDNVGIATQSYGVTMGAGCAGRHPEIPIKYLVDGEGPPDSFVTCHEPAALDKDPTNDKHEVIRGILGHYSASRDPSPSNRAFWSEREAINFIGKFRGKYLRLQAQWDHAQPPSSENEIALFNLPPRWWHNKHTTDIVNAAVAGGVPWVRVNLADQRNPINATYTQERPPVYLPGKLADKPWAVRAILEMARLK